MTATVGTLGLYLPGTSPLHRLPAGAKLGALAAAGAGSVWVDTPAQTAAALVTVLALHPLGRVPARVVTDMLRPLLWMLVPLSVFQLLVIGWARTTVLVGVILALVLLANLVTLTTRTTDLVDVVVTLCRPLRVVGVDPVRVGLLLSLAIRCVPLVIELAAEVRDAQRARGLESSPRALVVPLLVRTLRRADELGEALVARGAAD
ncbi:energy-coupling factor transporter transmembrane protein EcfT [Nocardioides eburneiflavus]|uniref:Energy-coupling factor transporter transmembrane protein EcfT n=1 Tax=Nocardioides eburneiflavus TaxID=2518372 RepID=A0A4Z1CDH7_9ACTN|nr:energy-coupling factor transporter transmembrane protein EcfT [Nocardioides eburneiflavus]TGN63815.1 energy-coupling factor transporter transmembrane protein EcfT [Nocardioides eburneiflavus]